MRYYCGMSNAAFRQSGQIALMVLLMLGITLVVAVSLAQRTTEDVALTTKQAETTKVFSAAQSVAEEKLNEVLTALKTTGSYNGAGGGPVAVPAINDSDVTVEVQQLTNFVQPLEEGESYQINLAGLSSPVDVEWGDSSAACGDQASLLVARFFMNGANVDVEYFGYYPRNCGANPHGSDGFDQALQNGSDGRSSKIVLGDHPSNLFARVIPLYDSTNLYVNNSNNEQYVVTATAVNQLGDDEETRIIEVSTSDLQPPSFLDYAVYSGTTIRKP